MPDDLAKKGQRIGEQETLWTRDDLPEAIEDLARGISLMDPNPVDWRGWVVYSLGQMERLA